MTTDMNYIEFREHDHEELVEKLHKAKKAICEAWEAIERSGSYNERGGRYRMGEGGNMGYRMSRRDDMGGGASRYEY